MPQQIIEQLKKLPQVQAIALGGSRSTGRADEKSDYDFYVYVYLPISAETRKALLTPYCKYVEIDNRFWEAEDDCVLNSGVEAEFLYRNVADFLAEIDAVVKNLHVRNNYNTCMWNNLLCCKILYDRDGVLTQAQKDYSFVYPDALKKAIVRRQQQLLYGALPAFATQIEKAAKRGDKVSVNHRLAEFLASYFDLLFALNGKTHPGEKRLVQLCKEQCDLLPKNFEKNLDTLFEVAFCPDKTQLLADTIRTICENVEKLCDVALPQ